MSVEERRVPAAESFAELSKLKGEGYNVLVDLTAVDYSAWGGPVKGDQSDALKRAHPAERGNVTHTIASAVGEEYGTPHLPGRPSLDEPRPAAPVKTRFDLVYRLMKLDPETGEDQGRVYLHCDVPEGVAVLRSARSLWPIADWLEREVWDMFGIKFSDRPDIKRLLLYEEFHGHPLRKDYPITRRQPIIGPKGGELEGSPSFNQIREGVKYE